ncbi:small G protein signaling modulator 1-like isoform X2 [Portunus trituberculatus]|uniref:small G protein signaling modulator 1-like isoform X2 n=1 Tax=Portunus trituberculatus TaxID=210409 RepID=UPI001E1CFCB3|nr:small G protein signaling modulator 1-like isoform X2 [Portunus trituberculatus]
MSIIIDEEEFKAKLIGNMKKEVKQIMEEAVTRKFVHEESSSITSLCGAVEACLSHGLKRRTLGLFKTSSTTALIHKVSKSFSPAATVSKIVQEIENSDAGRRSSGSGDSASRLGKPPLVKKNSGSMSGCVSPPRYLWIRVALFEKVLAKIIDYLVQNSSKYYEKDSLVADPDYGTILSSLLVGPCALDFSRMKTADHLWTDPPADELVQRHRISSGHLSGPATPPVPRRPGLHYRKPVTCNSEEVGAVPPRSVPLNARDYVESLHQNNKATLLYGKNNVHVQPKEQMEAMPGYMSLHQTTEGLVIKWTPNHLMNGCCPDTTEDKRWDWRRHSLPCLSELHTPPQPPSFLRRYSETPRSIYWEYALNVRVEEIVYVHCHQQGDSGGTIVLVGQDGTQYPPIHFPRGGHLLAFLSCLENGLLPHGHLDPPLWSQRGKGKVFPKLRRKARALAGRHQADSDDDEASDYVFRIITSLKPDRITHGELISPLQRNSAGWLPRVPKLSSHSSSTSSSKSISLGDSISESHPPPPTPNPSLDVPLPPTEESKEEKNTLNKMEKNSDSLEILCATMKHQIISRAFYGWLAHCRHLRTVRTHLAGLVLPSAATPPHVPAWEEGVTEEAWEALHSDGCLTNQEELLARVYLGGVAHPIRKQVWPYLLNHYTFGSNSEQRAEQDRRIRQTYETTMSEWLAVEAIVRQRDKEVMAINMLKLSSESQNGEIPLVGRERSLSNEVFEPDTVQEEEENSAFDGSCPSKDVMENNRNRVSNREDVESPHTRSKENSVEDDRDFSEMVYDKEKLRQESKESDTAEAANNTCVITPDEGVEEGQEPTSPQNAADGTAASVSASFTVETCNPPTTTPVIVSKASLDSGSHSDVVNGTEEDTAMDEEVRHITENGEDEEDGCVKDDITENGRSDEDKNMDTLAVEDSQDGHSVESRSSCISPASSQGGVYSTELLDTFGLNLHRIDKDVQRCDRNYWYFTHDNLEKLRNVMCTYVWEHLDTGYMQGMCDLVAPLLVVFDDEAATYSCFCQLMARMCHNFPNGGAMDQHFANMRSLIQILDSEMFELMHQNGDYTHFYFCYRWFLLDFKRELVYEDVFRVWEAIWSARHVSSAHFVLFIALALVEYYRDIILDNNMDFTDIIKFFNEMAERHDAKIVLHTARNLVLQLQTLIENK